MRSIDFLVLLALCIYERRNPILLYILLFKNIPILVRRKKEPFKGLLSIPGGFVNEGERVEDAAKREAKEETSLDIELVNILGVYSEPNRDQRGHIISTFFYWISPNNKVEALAQDDAAEIKRMNLEELDNTSIKRLYQITKSGRDRVVTGASLL